MTEMLSFGQPLGAIMQVAYIVEDIEKAMKHWTENVGIGPFYLFEHFELLDYKYRGTPSELDITLAMAYSGSMAFELIVQHSPSPSVYTEVIEKRGYGFHHWAVSTRTFDDDVARYEKSGAEQALYGMVPIGARAGYADTYDKLGGFIELIEIKDEVEELFSMIKSGSVDWDGKDPVRTPG